MARPRSDFSVAAIDKPSSTAGTASPPIWEPSIRSTDRDMQFKWARGLCCASSAAMRRPGVALVSPRRPHQPRGWTRQDPPRPAKAALGPRSQRPANDQPRFGNLPVGTPLFRRAEREERALRTTLSDSPQTTARQLRGRGHAQRRLLVAGRRVAQPIFIQSGRRAPPSSAEPRPAPPRTRSLSQFLQAARPALASRRLPWRLPPAGHLKARAIRSPL